MSTKYTPIRFGPRCDRCRVRWRRPAFMPYCSYHCQEWAKLEQAAAYISTLPSTPGQGTQL